MGLWLHFDALRRRGRLDRPRCCWQDRGRVRQAPGEIAPADRLQGLPHGHEESAREGDLVKTSVDVPQRADPHDEQDDDQNADRRLQQAG